jgi:hypothetical protein
MAAKKKTLDLAAAAAAPRPTAVTSGTRAGRSAAAGKPRRSTVDLPTDISKQLVIRARKNDLTNQAVLAALATAYATGDERAVAIVQEFSSY